MQVLFCGSIKRNREIWILDSGASDHVCCTKEQFVEMRDINPIPIQLPNGMIIKAMNSGSVQLGPNILLKDVLYLTMFTFNLVSISRLTTLKYIFKFIDDYCCIHDQKKLTIGLARKLGRLYHVDLGYGITAKESLKSVNSTANKLLV